MKFSTKGQTKFSWRRISQSEIRNSAAAESEGGQKSESLIVVGCPGIEPGTSYLSGKRSTDELVAHKLHLIYLAQSASYQECALTN